MSTCQYCESEKVIVKRIPEHRRWWRIGNEEFTEYMGEADDYECVDCERMWTIYREEMA